MRRIIAASIVVASLSTSASCFSVVTTVRVADPAAVVVDKHIHDGNHDARMLDVGVHEGPIFEGFGVTATVRRDESGLRIECSKCPSHTLRLLDGDTIVVNAAGADVLNDAGLRAQYTFVIGDFEFAGARQVEWVEPVLRTSRANIREAVQVTTPDREVGRFALIGGGALLVVGAVAIGAGALSSGSTQELLASLGALTALGGLVAVPLGAVDTFWSDETVVLVAPH